MDQELIRLMGGQQYATHRSDDAFTVLEGTVYLYIFHQREGQSSRRFFLCALNEGDSLPALDYQDGEGLRWQFALMAESAALLRRDGGQGSPALMEDLLRRCALPTMPGVPPEEALAEFYRLRLVREEGDIYRAAKEQHTVYEEGLHRIADLFIRHDVGFSGRTGHPLYDAVALLCQAEGIEPVSYEALLESRGHRFTLQDMADLSGFLCREVVLEEGWFRRDMGSLLVFAAEKDTPLVCLSTSSHSYALYTPQSGTKTRLTAKESAGLDTNAWIIYPPLEQKKLGLRDFLKAMWRTVRLGDLLAFFLMFLLVTLVGLLLPYLNQQLYDLYIPMGDATGLWQFCLLMFSTTGGLLCFTLVKNYALFRMESSSKYNLQAALLDRVFNLPQNFLDKFSATHLGLYAMGVSSVVPALYNAVLSALVGVLFSVFFLCRMFAYSSRLTWLALGILLVVVAVVMVLNLWQIKKERAILTADVEANNRIYQTLSGIAKIRVAGVENRALLEYLKPYTTAKRLGQESDRLTLFANLLIMLLPALTTLMFYSQIIAGGSAFSIGELMGLQAAFAAFSAAFIDMVQALFSSSGAIPAYEQLKPILETPPERQAGATQPGKLTGDIDVSNLSFRYEGSEHLVLEDLSFHIHPGEYVGIVGSSGCGKSTLFKLLLGFEHPTVGKIYYDGLDIDSLDKRELRKKLGVVLQDGKLIPGSIWENVTIAARHTDSESVNSALERVGLLEDIAQMPMGLQTLVNEDGSTISGGQRQRLLIARAILANPAVFYLDEATSALDNVTQKLVCDSLAEMGCTRVVIAHRLSTVLRCDRILVMDEGHMVEQGSYEELMEREGVFAALVRRQLI
ncbi:MAG: NHLP bacteriocin export ABC transporter permease/ATPase subunit [Oscillospiraceae bacterium]